MTDSSKKNKGYGCVAFEAHEEAKKCLDKFNGQEVNGKKNYDGRAQKKSEQQADFKAKFYKIKIEQQNRYAGINLYVKNLDDTIDDERLYQEFSQYGTITSAKVMTDSSGKSKGFGFVAFETHEEAEKCLDELNGKEVNGKKIYAGWAQKKSERQAELITKYDKIKIEQQNRYAGLNLYVNNLDDTIDDKRLCQEFSQFGTITSAKVMTDSSGKSKGFGFVAFETHEEAEKCLDELNDKEVNGKKIYADWAQKNSERQAESIAKYDKIKIEQQNRYAGLNLYVNNLDDTIDDKRLCQEFSQFGTITSAKVMTEGGRSKGYGFVCFQTAEEATKAVTEMNNNIICCKLLYVALAQNKEDRKSAFASQYIQRLTSTLRVQPGNEMTPIFHPQASTGGYQQALAAQRAYAPNHLCYNRYKWQRNACPQHTGAGANQSYRLLRQQSQQPHLQQKMQMAAPPHGMLAAALQQQQLFQQQMINAKKQQQQNVMIGGTQNAANGSLTAARAISGSSSLQVGLQQLSQPGAMDQVPRPTLTPLVPSQPITAPVMSLGPSTTIIESDLTSSQFVAIGEVEQKSLIENRIFQIISGIYAEDTHKLTDMLLEMDNSELLHMLEDQELLKQKVNEFSMLKAQQQVEERKLI